MNHLRFFVACMAAIFLLALADHASATALTSPTGTVATPFVELEGEGNITIDTRIGSEAKPASCNWAVAGQTQNHGKELPVSIALTTLSLTSCTNNWHATPTYRGELTIEGTAGYDGTVTWQTMTVIMTWGGAGVTCNYLIEAAHVGTFTGGSPATIDLEGALTFESGSLFCGEAPRELIGSLKVNSPSELLVD